MEHKDRLKFVKDMTELAMKHTAVPEVQHLDSGGAVAGGALGGVGAGIGSQVNTQDILPGGGWSGGSSGVIGGINDFLGTTDNFQAGSAPITAGTNQDQLNTAYTGAQSGLAQQQNIANTVAPGVATGVTNQGILANQLAAESMGQGPNPAQAQLNQATGQNIQQQAALMASQRGAGANPAAIAEAASRQGAATQQQAVGQSATLSAEQQLAAQQQAAGLAATQVNQGVGAVQGVNQQQQNEQQILQNANTAANNANVGMQSNINSTNAQTAIANQNAAQNTLGGILSGVSSVAGLFAKGGLVKMDRGGNVLDAEARKHIAPENFALPGGRYPIHDISHARNALARVSQHGTSAEKSKVQSAVHKKYPELAKPKKMADGGQVTVARPTGDTKKPAVQDPSPYDQTLSNGWKNVKSAFGYATGGCVKDGYMAMLAGGGPIGSSPLTMSPAAGPQSMAGQWINTEATGLSGPNIQTPQLDVGKPADLSKTVKGMKMGGSTKGSPGDLPGEDEDTFAQPDVAGGPMDAGLAGADTMLAAKGGGVQAKSKSEKASIKGDNLKNDKIPAMLSQGEVVIDRDTMADPGPMGQMARALAKHIEKRNKH